MVEFGITVIIYLGAVLMNGSFNANHWHTSYDYDAVLNGWRIVIFAITTLAYFIGAMTGGCS